MADPQIERRANPFTEKLSMRMLTVAAFGAFLVLFDPTVTLHIAGQVIAFGGVGFSSDLKGAVITAILIRGWQSVGDYWLGSSVGNVKSAESIQRIAEASPAVQTAAVLAATTGLPADNKTVTMKVDEPLEVKITENGDGKKTS